VLSSHGGLLCNWTVTGAAAAASTTTEVTIPVLPPAGTKVTVDVVMTNDLGLRARGHYEFVSTVRLGGLAELERLVACRVGQLKQVAVFIPPWVPVEVGTWARRNWWSSRSRPRGWSAGSGRPWS
jgi:hypothetical protein